MKTPQAEILCLGNELLIGRTINKNATDIARRLTKRGFKVTRITTVRDDLDLAVEALQEIFDRKPIVVCISGGLGPTHDDIQLEVVGKATNKVLKLNENALSMIQKKYNVVNKSRRKMALLPEGSKPLANTEGSAPGVVTEYSDIYIFSLPGVPREMKDIMDKEVLPYIDQHIQIQNQLMEFGCDIRGARESDIAEITNQIRKKFDLVNFKSHPKKDERGYYLSLHTYSIDAKREDVERALRTWKNAIEESYSINSSEIKPVFDASFDGDDSE